VLIHTRCPIDDTDEFDVEVYPANFDVSLGDAHTFSARRMPDGVHYRMVRSTRSGCLRADPILDEETIQALYRDSEVTYERTAVHAANTYLRHLPRALSALTDKRGVLEIGCGHGFFLERLLNLGFEKVAGVEPSEEAVEKAEPNIRGHIVNAALRPGLFPAASFSLVCGFQVLDHLVRPNETLQLCRELLAPGGIMFWICHDEGSFWSRLLGRRSPIVDLEHVVLYNRTTIRMLFERNGFQVIRVFGVANSYPLRYWGHLAPIPRSIKLPLLRLLKLTRLGDMVISASFGNMGIVARRLESDSSRS
jgi:SAM-dependent methyltransferase